MRFCTSLLLLLLPLSLAAAQSTGPNPQISGDFSPVTILENTPLSVLTASALSTRHAHEGEPLFFTLNQDVFVNNVLIIPRGAAVRGVIVHSHQAGHLKGGSHLEIKLTSLELEGRTYPLYTYHLQVDTNGKGRVTAVDTVGGTEYGALAGAIFAGDKAYASRATKLADIGGGAVAGAGLGMLASASTTRESATIPAESQIDFYLAMPISVTPVSAQEASRLAQHFQTATGSGLHLRSQTP